MISSLFVSKQFLYFKKVPGPSGINAGWNILLPAYMCTIYLGIKAIYICQKRGQRRKHFKNASHNPIALHSAT